MYEKDIWDDVNQEWISWDEVLSYDMDEAITSIIFFFTKNIFKPRKTLQKLAINLNETILIQRITVRIKVI